MADSQMAPTPIDWWSVHIFLFDPSASEACLIDEVLPAVRDLLSSKGASAWFFIRYWEGGPHIRLRLANINKEARTRFLEELRPKVEKRRSELEITRDSYYGQHSFDGEPLNIEDLSWFGDAQIAEVAYEPETVRYGGPKALPLSEQLFGVSSELAIQIIGATRDDPSKRMGAGFALMLAAAAIAGQDGQGIAAFCDNYASMWSMYSEQTEEVSKNPLASPSAGHLAAVEAILTGAELPWTFARHWHQSLKEFRQQLEHLGEAGSLLSPLDGTVATTAESIKHAILAVLWSQVHMINNRLAILPAHEVLLARTVAAAARRHLNEKEANA